MLVVLDVFCTKPTVTGGVVLVVQHVHECRTLFVMRPHNGVFDRVQRCAPWKIVERLCFQKPGTWHRPEVSEPYMGIF